MASIDAVTVDVDNGYRPMPTPPPMDVDGSKTYSTEDSSRKVVKVMLAVIALVLFAVLIVVVIIVANDGDDVPVAVPVPVAANCVGVTPPKGWSYDATSTMGPARWNEIEGFALCSTGQKQTPIDLPIASEGVMHAHADLALQEGLSMSGECKTFEGHVNDHTWEVSGLDSCPEGGKYNLRWVGKDYIMKQFHLHSPSEHTIGGKSFDAEIHFVFVPAANTAGTGPVIGVMLEGSSSADNAFLQQFWPHFDNEEHELDHAIDPYAQFFPGSGGGHDGGAKKYSSYYQYSGSYTTPGCNEGIPWILFTNPVQISFNQLNQYKHALTELPQTYKSLTNNRPIQPLNNRPSAPSATHITWTYDTNSNLGPTKWGANLDAACNSDAQSPINLLSSAIVNSSLVAIGTAFELEGACKTYLGEVNDHTWEVGDLHECAEGGKFKLAWEGTDYIMKQFHFHSPSEHTVDGKHFAMEAHFVFFTEAGETGPVIGVLLDASTYKNSSAQTWLSQYTFDNEKHSTANAIDPREFFPTNQQYWHYTGSYTTPSCKNGIVPWLVLTTPVAISHSYLYTYVAALKDLPQTYNSMTNNRPIQDTNGRTVQKSD